jgi:hypothetical protein
MTHFKAIITEKCSQQGQIVGNTKNGIYKGMSKDEFEVAVKKSCAFRFEIVAI